MKDLSDVDTNTIEGRYLMACLAHISEVEFPDKTPLQIMDLLRSKVELMYPLSMSSKPQNRLTFEKELQQLINRYSKENDSNTPDFLLQKFITDTLSAVSDLINSRDKWYSFATGPHGDLIK